VAGSHLTDPKDCSCFLIQDEPSVLIDCGSPDGIPFLTRNMGATGVDLKDVGVLIGTHGHYDHVGGAAALKEIADIPLWLHPDDRQAVESGDGVLTASEMMYNLAFPPVRVDSELFDGQVVELANSRLTIVHTPGHTAGSVCILAAWGNFTVLFAGDTVWGGYHLAFFAGIETWWTSLDKLLTHNFDVMVWGHSGSILYGDAKQRVQEARQALGVYFVPWRIPISDPELRYGGDALNPGRHESNGVP
jgi:glyoxylase-like metal-dependent hydrolase (beta-lactamase superfamily II)